jgi:hypothetical protein
MPGDWLQGVAKPTGKALDGCCICLTSQIIVHQVSREDSIVVHLQRGLRREWHPQRNESDRGRSSIGGYREKISATNLGLGRLGGNFWS